MSFQAERTERTAIMQEEDDRKEQQRQNFNNMVAEARAEAARNPPPPHDPMRFRAIPPGKKRCMNGFLPALWLQWPELKLPKTCLCLMT